MHNPQVFGVVEQGSRFSNVQFGEAEQLTVLRIDVAIARFCLIMSISTDVAAWLTSEASKVSKPDLEIEVGHTVTLVDKLLYDSNESYTKTVQVIM
jgi:hypothetical protein